MKKNMNEEYEKLVDNTKVVRVPVEDEMKKSFIAYAMAVNVSRAIPDVRDGLKPVHRRILYSMGELGLSSDKPYRKCARIVGDVLGKYHPHGDQAVYAALVRLAQDFSVRAPLVDGHGNFGSIDNDPPAAQRYTEARMSKIAGEMMRDIEKETVDFYPNFDDTLMQPVVLPSRFPNLLVNGADGIAVGMATNIPPHNLGEVIDGAVALLGNAEISVDELASYIPAPDYPTGGILMGRMGLRHAYKTGRGSFVLRARAEIEEYTASKGDKRNRIAVTELPYQVVKSQLIETIAEMVKDKRIEGISDLRDESDRKGMRMVIELKRDAQPQVVLNTLYKHTNLQVSGGIIFLALVNGEPKILNLKEILYHYLEHQREVVVRRTKYDLARAEERAHIVEGLVIALANIDEVIAIIKKSRDKFAASEQLQKRFVLSEKQATAILEMRLQRLTSLEVEQLKNELSSLKNLIAELKGILADSGKVDDIIKTELLEIKEKYGDERRTEISVSDEYDDIDIGDLIDREDVVISMTHTGYIKRLPVTEYRTQRRGGRGALTHRPKDDEDFVENIFVTCTHDYILFFTNTGKVYRIKGYQVPEEQKTARGRNIVNLLQLADGERVQAILPVKEGTNSGHIMMATKRGLVKKTKISEFERIQRVGKIAITLTDGDELISVQLTGGRDELLLASGEGKAIRFSEDDVRATGRGSQGVRSMRISDDDKVVDMITLKDGDFKILTLSEFGYGKRTEKEDYRLQSRGGKGTKAGVFDARTGRLVNLKLVAPDEDIMVISDDGTAIRMRASEIRIIGRATKGVRVMRVKENCKIICVAVAQGYEDTADGGAST